MHVKNNIVLVTGANRGLGAALVQELLARGAAKVYATSRKPHDFGDPRVVNVPLDLADADSIKALVKQAPDANLLINNAGVFLGVTLLGGDMQNVRTEFETHVFGPLQLTQAFAPVLKSNGGGAVVFVNSAMSWLPGGSYGASKAGLLSITNALRLELAAQGTKVMSVHSGPIDTDMVKMLNLPKLTPTAVAKAVIDGVEHGESEVLVDELTKHAKSIASGPVDALQFAV